MTVELDALELEMLQGLAIGKALGESSSRVANQSKRLLEVGFVEHGPDGQLRPTEAGKTYLVARMQGRSS